MNKITIKNALNALAKIDQGIASGLEQVGYPEPRFRPAGLTALLSIIVSQQISAVAAMAIMGRVRTMLPRISPEAVLALPEGALREAGLSNRKVIYVTGVAAAIVAGEFSPERLSELDDEAAIRSISSLHGFGRWSAEIYLMFSLQRQDIFPADDLALQNALQKLKVLEKRPTSKCARALTEAWSPNRSAGSLFLWHYYKNTD